MPPVSWPSAPATVVAAFESRHSDPEAGALLHWAFSSVDALHYMSDLDAAYDQNRVVPGGHIPDVVDVAHARWATGTSITALDLAAAGLARALGGHPGPRELDFGDFASPKPGKAVATVVNAMPAAAMTWIRNVSLLTMLPTL